MDAQNQRYRYGNGSALFFRKVLAYGRTYLQSFGKFSKVWGLARAPSARKSSPNSFALEHCSYKITAEYFDRRLTQTLCHNYSPQKTILAFPWCDCFRISSWICDWPISESATESV